MNFDTLVIVIVSKLLFQACEMIVFSQFHNIHIWQMTFFFKINF